MKSLPEAFKRQMQQLLGEEYEAFLMALDNPVRTSVRLNPSKPSDCFSNETAIPWCNAAYTLHERPSFIADPLFHAGAYYVQESSSMFLSSVYDAIRSQLPALPNVLVLCAAPGGKTTLLSDCMKGQGLLVSNEVIRQRVQILEENVNRWGAPHVMVVQHDPKDFKKLPSFFDLIVVDAPCSGEGMFRKDPHAIDEWSESHVTLCSRRQERILDDILSSLKPGGFLVYSTCTFNHDENEEQVMRLIQEYGMIPVAIPLPDATPIHVVSEYKGTALHAYRFFPHRVEGEGLFMTCLRKPTTDDTHQQTGTNQVSEPLPARTREILKHWIKPEFDGTYLLFQNRYWVIPEQIAKQAAAVLRTMRTHTIGIAMGAIIREELIPDHALALSQVCSNQIPAFELTLEDARKYLRKDVLSSSIFAETGWQLVTYQGMALGWVKVLPNRVNNYFPTKLRVLKNIG